MQTCFFPVLLKTFNVFFFFTVDDLFDYQGRSFLHIPNDSESDLKSEDPPDKCFLPKRLIHTW